LSFAREDDIWRFTVPTFEARFGRFLEEYTLVRHAEGRGSRDPAYYRSIPDRVEGESAKEWQIRARSFDALLESGLFPGAGPALRIADLGAGHGWLSARLASLGHEVVAVDLSADALDGLGAAHHHGIPLVKAQADFDHLPFASRQFDRAIWNASLHYSTDIGKSLEEALRILVPDGRVIVLDSPVYRSAAAGQAMLRERRGNFESKYGFASDALESEHYLTDARVRELSRQLGIEWTWIRPRYGWRYAARQLRARILGPRELARFAVLVGRRSS
jgi:SAM-dependent methyltransferase